MLSIVKLRVGQEAYQLTGVAQSLDDYYSGAGEAPGRWRGGGANRLGLTGDVHGNDLRAVLAGLAPGSGGLTPNGTELRTRKRRVPGFDLTFKLPKSASVLYAVSDDPRVQGAVIHAGEIAVGEALAWLEREAIRGQRGSHNRAWLDARRAAGDPGVERRGPRRITTSGVVAASFRHRTSRLSDPLLHWHVLVANLVEGADGRWSAFAHPDLYRAARAAGEIFQTAVRRELSQSLGVEWRPGRHVPEIAGVPDHLLDLFSKRRAEIDAWLAVHGRKPDTAANQEATLATRRGKPEMEGERLDAGWKIEAEQAGWGPDRAEHLLAGRTPVVDCGVGGVWRLPEIGFDEDGTAHAYDRTVAPEEWIADLLRRDLTHTATSFTRFDLTQAVAARLSDGATVATIERVVATVLASEQVLVVDGPGVDDPRGRGRYTSVEMLQVEERFRVALTVSGTRPPVPHGDVERAIAQRVSLGGDQAAAVYALCGSDRPVVTLVGPAGTGKTFTLDTVRDGYQHAGYHVQGAAPSARAAIELHAGAGIPSRTLHALVAAWERGDDHPDNRTVLVIDEAGMAGVRLLEKTITRTVAAGGRVLLVGDHRQLPEIEAGGGFAVAANMPGAVALSVNRRQREPWEQAALAALRDGHVPTAVNDYRNHGRVIIANDRQQMLDHAVDRWLAARDNGRRPVLLAGTNELVDLLNTIARERLIERGELPDTIDGYYGPRGFRVGERVVLRRNSHHARTLDQTETTIANGHTGTITALSTDRMTIRRDLDHTDITIDRRYLQAGGRVDHAYASTTTRAQGGTWDLAITVGLDGLYREAAYVDLSRGSDSNWLIITSDEAARVDELAELERHDRGLPLPGEHPDLDDEIVETLEQSRAKTLATAIDPHLAHTNRLAQTYPLDVLEARRDVCLDAERRAAEILGINPDVLAAAVDRAEHTARHITIGQKVKAWDRANIGTVVGLNDTSGEACVQFISQDGRIAERHLSWTLIEIIDPTPTERALSDPAQGWLDRLHHDVDATLARWRALLHDVGVQPGEARHLGRAVHHSIEQTTNLLIADQPDWLAALVGDQPADPTGAEMWTSAVRHVATHRARQHLTVDTPGLGPIPDQPEGRADWMQVSERLAITHVWLARHERPTIAWTRNRSRRELLERQDALDVLFADAPDDQRHLINRLQAGGQLDLDDAPNLLQEALDTQHERRDWILEHWPHIVEYDENQTALTHQLWGPDTTLLVDNLRERAGGNLADAIQQGDEWVTIAVAYLATQTATELSPDAVDYLHHLADYRHKWQITSRHPLGPTPIQPDHADDYDYLANRLDTLDLTGTTHNHSVRTPPVATLWDANSNLRDQLADIEAPPEDTPGIDL